MNKLVIDIGGTMMKYAVMSNDAHILKKWDTPTPLDSLGSLLQCIMESYTCVQNEVDGIAISMPGTIDSATGKIYNGGSLAYNNGMNIVKEIQKYIELPVSVENDGKSAALAEVWKGNLVDCNDGIVLVIGTAVGGGIVQNKKVIKGHHCFAGELSYLINDFNDLDITKILAYRGSTSSLIFKVAQAKKIDSASIIGEDVFKWLKENDTITLEKFDTFTMTLAGQIYNLQCILDPQRILIGGGISKDPILVEAIKQKLECIYSSVPMDIPRAEVDTCKYYNDSNLIGALYHHLMSV